MRAVFLPLKNPILDQSLLLWQTEKRHGIFLLLFPPVYPVCDRRGWRLGT
jgi:hypothetical protein